MVRPKNNMLRKKLYRDMSRAAMQFLSIIALCALGTFAFSALDGTARMIRTTLNTYYEDNNLADFWITLPTADRSALEKRSARAPQPIWIRRFRATFPFPSRSTTAK